MEKKIIDVSQWNGTANWNKVDCDGAIIRIAYRGYTAGTIKQDNMFLSNIQGATANDIPAGI
ncbi:glycosyl hydrolase family 25, partial [Lachnotalea glycerini]